MAMIFSRIGARSTQLFRWTGQSKRRLAGVGLVAIVPLVIVVVMVVSHRSTPAIPAAIQRQMTFAAIAPQEATQATVDTTSVKYDTSNKQLTYNLTQPSGGVMVVSQQESPISFSDVPEVYQKLLDRMNQYDSFEVPLGKVYLTKPGNLGKADVQVAVINSKGTLTFIRSDEPRSTDDWRRLLGSFDLVKK